tara:strand:+ start:1067 stop:1522 length:456 start_codon:yes stop_codon:yes gene_type:complete
MATTVNNTTVQTRISILFDADENISNPNDGPAAGTGNTESDVYLDDNVQLNLRSHTEIDSSIHALQWDATTNTGIIEYTDTRDNESISSFPQWATNVVIRAEAQDTWQTTFDSTYASQTDAGADDATASTAATTAANTARTDYLTAHSITY